MKKIGMVLAAGIAMFVALPASAQSRESAALSKCLDDHTTEADKILLMQWVFVGMAQSEAVKSMTTVTAAQREQYSKGVAKMFERLLVVDCRPEVVAAVRVDGYDVLEHSFGDLGERAMELLMKDPGVSAHFADFVQYVDMNAVVKVFSEATARP